MGRQWGHSHLLRWRSHDSQVGRRWARRQADACRQPSQGNGIRDQRRQVLSTPLFDDQSAEPITVPALTSAPGGARGVRRRRQGHRAGLFAACAGRPFGIVATNAPSSASQSRINLLVLVGEGQSRSNRERVTPPRRARAPMLGDSGSSSFMAITLAIQVCPAGA